MDSQDDFGLYVDLSIQAWRTSAKYMTPVKQTFSSFYTKISSNKLDKRSIVEQKIYIKS